MILPLKKMKPVLKQYSILILLSLISGMAGAWIFGNLNKPSVIFNYSDGNHTDKARSVGFGTAGEIDFITASELSTPTVVFIKTKSNYTSSNRFFWGDFEDLFGNRGPASTTGSGVIIQSDGYIVTNNHVVEKADEIEVILSNKKSYKAKILGTDNNSDLAVLKIEETGLPAIKISNSDHIRTGEWVLAVGNPFNLTSTVTAGIVSAIGRNINIVNSQFPIESFIQTDAVINPGNSGGALVNLKGELVGINTAILSQTGSYTGYGFAIPSNLVSKIVTDIIQFGIIQRPFLNAEYSDIDGPTADKIGLENATGVYVNSVINGGAADKAGLQPGDILLKIDGISITSKSFLDEKISYFRPGDKVKFTVKKGNDTQELSLTLTNKEGTTGVIKRNAVASVSLGADFEAVSKVEKDKLGISSGVKVSNIKSGRVRSMGLAEDFIIQYINRNEINNPEECINLLENTRGRITLEGVQSNGVRGYYTFYQR